MTNEVAHIYFLCHRYLRSNDKEYNELVRATQSSVLDLYAPLSAKEWFENNANLHPHIESNLNTQYETCIFYPEILRKFAEKYKTSIPYLYTLINRIIRTTSWNSYCIRVILVVEQDDTELE